MTDQQFADLLAVRTQLRRFLRWSEQRAVQVGLTPAQHQLILAIRGHDPGGTAPSVRDLSGYLLVRHNAVVELLDRASEAGLVTRRPDATDRRIVRIELTSKARKALDLLGPAHVDELRRLGPALGRLSDD